MPKTVLNFNEQINFLASSGTLDQLIAISYYRGETGKYAGPVRDFVAKGIREWVGSLSPAERKRYEEILANVKVTSKYRVRGSRSSGG